MVSFLRAVTLVAAMTPLADGQTELQKLGPSDRLPESATGYPVRLSGNTLVAGAYMDSTAAERAGAAYVYVRDTEGWHEEALLTAFDPAYGDCFGIAADIDGDTIVVGARENDHSGVVQVGAAYVFVRGAEGWELQAKLTAPDALNGDYFGDPVAIHGERILVSALGRYANGVDAGGVYVFVRDGETWNHETTLLGSQSEANAHFGYGAWLGDDVLVAGTTVFDGHLYVFERIDGAWVETERIARPDGSGSFGRRYGIDMDGDLLAVGAAETKVADMHSAGVVYLYRREPGGFELEARLFPEDVAAHDRFGGMVALEGDTLVSASYWHDAAAWNAGAAYVFTRGDGGWGQRAKLIASDAQSDDTFGIAVDVEGNTIAIGATGVDGPPEDKGAVYLFELPLGEPFCAGDGSAGPCRCANLGGAGEGCASSSGHGARLEGAGPSSESLDGARFTATGLPPGELVLLLAAANDAPALTLGDGLLCLGAPILRVLATSSDALGNAEFGPGLGRAIGWQAGESWFVQAWYRDSSGSPCGAGSNLTHARALLLTP